MAQDVAAVWADEVDRDARFPAEAIAALREAALLSCAVPTHRGGEGVSLSELCRIARVLGRHCAATGMVFAMHQSQMLSLVRHGDSEAIRSFVEAAMEGQYLLASATTELGIGGDVRRSLCAVERVGGRLALSKNAPVIS
ncbi:MAG: acyl-CoA dehydrogenase family protein, partial [Nocardiaceae bacterium]|nr:acyl-CoA dehydrogenase family protein [Nocardiaceae bacterium]